MAGSALDWFLAQRDRLLSSPAFHRGVLRFLPARLIARRRARQLFDIAAGFTYSQILAACVELDLFERLRDGPVDLATLCRECDLEAEALLRLLRGAAGLELLQPAGGDRWRLGELGAASLGSPGIAAMVRHHHMLYRDLQEPLALLRDRSQSRLGDYWAYAEQPGFSESQTAASYSELMAQSQSFVADDVLANCSLRERRQLLDVGGGSGVFAAEALSRFPKLKATVFDLEKVAPLAQQRFERLGLATRGSAQAGNMFAGTLPAGADVISLVRILHDHDDDAVVQLLRAARAALPSDGMLLIAEPMADTPAARSVGAYFEMYLWAMRSGRPRTRGELTRLLENNGFADVRERRSYQPLLVRILTARPAE